MTKTQKHSKKLTAKEREELLRVLEARFSKNQHRHKGMSWAKVRAKLESARDNLRSLYEMERTGGEPDVVGYNKRDGTFIFVDCSPESPAGRRSLCYDPQALEARAQHKPKGSALAMAAAMGVELLTEEQYRNLQELEAFDSKTSSWLATPAQVRKLGGAIFGDRRYDRVFIYHNGAQSYYAARGFRGTLKV